MRPASLVLLSAVLAVEVQAMNVIGSAYGVDDGELRYREIHQCSADGERCTVEYRDPSGDMFARKVVDYADSLQAPSLEMQDLRHGETVRVKGEAEGELVIDAGFDHYVRQRWEQLVKGDTLSFPFLVAGRDKPLQMKASKAASEGCPQERVCFTVALDNWLLSRLLPPIRLEYDAESQRLLQFKGVSNIRDAEGRSQQVRIDYRYSASSPEGSTS